MISKANNIRNIKVVKALRGNPLSIDLGLPFVGTLEAWMKKSPNDTTYRPFTIVDGQYLTMTGIETSDFYDGETLVEAVEGKWYFDVEWTPDTEGAVARKIYTGSIIFYNDVTNSGGVQALPLVEVLETPYTIEINQTAHGFTIGDAIKFNGTEYILAQADLEANAGVLGLVNEIVGVDSFTYQFGGVYTKGTWTEGASYFLSTGVAGQVDESPVFVDGQYEQFVGTKIEEGLLINIDYGIVAGSGGESTFDSSLSNTLAMEDAVGSIPAGTTIGDLQGYTFTRYIEEQNFPTVLAFISDISNLIMSGYSTATLEVGTGYSFTAAMSFDTGNINNGDGTSAGPVSGDALTFRLENPDGAFYANNSVVANSDSHITAIYSLLEGTNSWVLSGTNQAGVTTYTDNKGGTDVVASIESAKADTIPNNVTLNKQGLFPYFYGMSAVDLSTGGTALYTGQTKYLVTSGNKSVALNGTNEYIQFAYPQSYGLLSQIKDGNGFDVTGSFTLYSVNVISSGQTTEWTEPYYVYQTTSVTSVVGQTYEFNQ